MLPQAIRRKMNLRTGDEFDTKVEGDRIVLVPKKKRRQKYRVVKDPRTGLAVISAGKNGPRITNQQVIDMLADFP